VQTNTGVTRRKPKQKGRSSIPVRERILVAAGDLFNKVGIRGVGVEAIAEAAHTNKMTLYRYFESKDELIAEWVRGMIAHKEEDWKDLNARYRGDPHGLLKEWSRRVSARLSAMEARGSALGNALAELPDPKHPARRVIHLYKQREHQRVLRLCKAARFRDPKLSANLFYMMLEGAHGCGQCIGMRQIGEQLVEIVDLMVENSLREQRADAAG